MLDCSDCERLIARAADDPTGVAGDLRRLNAHLAACAACRSALGDQRAVATALAARPPAALPVGFHERLATRLDGEASWLPLVNWRAWTVGLAPIAAALLLVAWLTPDADTSTTTSSAATAASQTAPTFDTWAASNVRSPAAAALLQPDITGDSLLEVVLTNNTAPLGAGSDVR
jgi:anti-sigma factor RsiW